MKFVLVTIILSLSSALKKEDVTEDPLEIDEFTNLDIYNSLPDPETTHPEIEDGFLEAKPPTAPTNYTPLNFWDKWIDEHLTETVLWAVIFLLTVTIIGIACCLFEVSNLLYDLVRNEVEVIQLQPLEHTLQV